MVLCSRWEEWVWGDTSLALLENVLSGQHGLTPAQIAPYYPMLSQHFPSADRKIHSPDKSSSPPTLC